LLRWTAKKRAGNKTKASWGRRGREKTVIIKYREKEKRHLLQLISWVGLSDFDLGVCFVELMLPESVGTLVHQAVHHLEVE